MNEHNQFPIPRRYLSQGALDAKIRCHPELRSFCDTWTGDTGSLLLGPTGCGKTLVAAFASQRICKIQSSETWVKWVRADQLSHLLNEHTAMDQLNQLNKARVLVIDELGYERWPELVLEVLGTRHDWDRPTLVTCGLKQEQLLKRYSEATARKIIEIASGGVIDCWEKRGK